MPAIITSVPARGARAYPIWLVTELRWKKSGQARVIEIGSLSFGSGVSDPEFRIRSFGSGVSDPEFRIRSFGSGVSDREFRTVKPDY
jgi:hypothetical protein